MASLQSEIVETMREMSESVNQSNEKQTVLMTMCRIIPLIHNVKIGRLQLVMKKKILFIISNMETGGVSKSMTSLMNVIDRERYDVSLMIVSPTGAFIELLPQDLRLITNPVWSALTSRIEGSWQLLKTGHPLLAIGNCLRLTVSLFSKAKAGEMIAWMMPAIDEEFDTVIDFNGQQQLYYMVGKLKARKKITFFHSDYAKWSYYYNADKKYFTKADHIFTISELCINSLKHFFPEASGKIGLMENITSLPLIENMASMDIHDMDKNKFKLLTVGHVCENKGILWAIDAADILKKHGVDFHWYFLGTIDSPDCYNKLIAQAGLESHITFLGIRTNPYPYIRHATLIVHPSKFEGRSIALDEAKLLCKPIVVTKFSTVNDQFTDRHNASICEMNPESIANAIEELLNDNNLQQRYIENLLAERHDNSSEIEKLYRIFNE